MVEGVTSRLGRVKQGADLAFVGMASQSHLSSGWSLTGFCRCNPNNKIINSLQSRHKLCYLCMPLCCGAG